MDTKLIRSYGKDILCYRIRSARQKKRMQYRDFDKHLIKLNRQRKELYKLKWNLGWEPLVPPVQKGWKRYFVLREDVAESKQAVFYENILKKINTLDWSWRKHFLVKKRRNGRKIYIPKKQDLLRPYSQDFHRLGFTEAEKQLFHPLWHIDRKGQFSVRYIFSEPWRFVLQVRPNIIDKVKKRDPELERQLHRINNYFERTNYDKRLSKLSGGNYRWRMYREKLKEKDTLKNKSLWQLIDASSY